MALDPDQDGYRIGMTIDQSLISITNMVACLGTDRWIAGDGSTGVVEW